MRCSDLGVLPKATARRRYAAGTLPVPAYRLGRLVLVGVPVIGATADAGRVVVYAGVSSGGQETDLDGRVARVAAWVTGQGNLAVSRVVTEVGSAVNGHAAPVRHVDLELPGDAKTGRGAHVRPVRPAPAGGAAGREASRPSGVNVARQRTAADHEPTEVH